MIDERMEMNSWFTIDDSRLVENDEPILTVERNGDKWGNVIVHKSAEELEQIIRDNSGALGGLARLALEILSLRTYEAELLDALARAVLEPYDRCSTQAPPMQSKTPRTPNR